MNRRKQIEQWAERSGQSFHSVVPMITARQAVQIQQKHGIDVLNEALAKRAGLIAREKGDPLRNGWEPPMWWLCDALRGQKFASPAWEKRFPGVD
jgi:hypothetical protein